MTEPFEDPAHEWNSSKHHSGKRCVEGCGRPAGTAWSPYFCFQCNAERMRRIDRNLKEIVESFEEHAG